MVATNMPETITILGYSISPPFSLSPMMTPVLLLLPIALVGINQLSPLKGSHNFRMVGTSELLKSMIRSVVPFVQLLS